MKSILFLQTKFITDGPGLVVRNIIDHLDRTSFMPLVGCMYEGGELEDWYKANSIATINLEMKGPLNGWIDIFAMNRLLHFIKMNQVDLIHTHLIRADIYGRIAARIAGIPVISTIHNTEEHHNSDALLMSFIRYIDKKTSGFCIKLITVSDFVQQYLCSLYGLEETNLTTIHNGIQPPPLAEAGTEKIKELPGSEKDVIICTVARLHQQKGIFDFIRAIDLIKKQGISVKGIIVGDGPLREEVSLFIEKMNADIFLTGFQKNVFPFIQTSDIFVLSSLWEGFGMSIVEAMSLSKPVAATRAGGIPEIVEDGITGLLCDPGDFVKLSENIMILIKNPELRKEMGETGFLRYRSLFTAETMSMKYQDIYKDILEKGNR